MTPPKQPTPGATASSSKPTSTSVSSSSGLNSNASGTDISSDGGGASSLAGGAGVSPTVRRRVLAAELKQLRRTAGFTHVDVAHRLGWQQGKVSKIEGAKQGIGVDAVIALADVCHADDEQRDRLVGLAHSARRRAWWEGFGDVLATGELTSVGLEVEADSMHLFVAEFVPTLLRTTAYARATEDASGRSFHGGVERRLELLLRRQTTVLAAGGADVQVVLSESAVRRRVGDVDVMGEQLEYLIELAERENVVLRLLPFDAGAVPVNGSFTVLGFRRVAHPDLVVVPEPHDCTCVEERGAVEAYRTEVGALTEWALSPEQSLDRLRSVIQEHKAEAQGYWSVRPQHRAATQGSPG